ncbi:MAG: glycosyltransferase [Acidimicrobiales bacterium]|nr:glycosyltransferase [Acidimicrobiales bacterium]
MTAPQPAYDHIVRLTGEHGIFEHADHTDPRRGHGHCTDDMARLLLVTAREQEPDSLTRDLARFSLRFLTEAQGVDGSFRNRRSSRGRWLDRRTVEDCWGRSLWGLGTAAARSDDAATRQIAMISFERGAQLRSPWPRAMAFAALGAAEVLQVHPGHLGARRLLADLADRMDGSDRSAITPSWPWPEPRLTYANAALPDAMIAAGDALGRPALLDDGLALLGWLLDRETLDGHLSVTPVGGAGPGDAAPAFDQQPIEVAALADACARAATLTGDARWSSGVVLAVGWFLGDNDAGAPMWDPVSQGGFDGLHQHGPNRNQGAESTLALLSTLQHARHLQPVSAGAPGAASATVVD